MDSDININNILLIIKYYNNNDNKNITSQLVSTFNKTFLESDKISISDKIKILININGLIENRIGCILINNIKKNIGIIDENIIVNFAKLCNIYNQIIPDYIIENHPELLFYSKNGGQN